MKNFKEHAIMRYLSRKLGEHIINDKTFQGWKKLPGNIDLYQLAIKEMAKIEIDCDFRVSDKVGNDQKKVEYAINTSEMAIFVIERNDVITYYKLEYSNDISAQSNLSLFKTFKREYDSANKKLDSFDLKNEKKKTKSEAKIELYNSEIQFYEDKIKELKSKREIDKQTLISIEQEKQTLTKNINTILLKMVKPVTAF